MSETVEDIDGLRVKTVAIAPSYTSVSVWDALNGLEMNYTVAGCVEIKRYFNGFTPESATDDEHVDRIHVCDLAEFIATLSNMRYVAAPRWRPQ